MQSVCLFSPCSHVLHGWQCSDLCWPLGVATYEGRTCQGTCGSRGAACDSMSKLALKIFHQMCNQCAFACPRDQFQTTNDPRACFLHVHHYLKVVSGCLVSISAELFSGYVSLVGQLRAGPWNQCASMWFCGQWRGLQYGLLQPFGSIDWPWTQNAVVCDIFVCFVFALSKLTAGVMFYLVQFLGGYIYLLPTCGKQQPTQNKQRPWEHTWLSWHDVPFWVKCWITHAVV